MAGKLNKSDLARKLGISRSSLYYGYKMDIKDCAVKERIEEVLASNPYYGHKRLAIELAMNKKKILRIMKKYGLKPRRRKKTFVKDSAGHKNMAKALFKLLARSNQGQIAFFKHRFHKTPSHIINGSRMVENYLRIKYAKINRA